MNIINRIAAWWRKRQRATDRTYLKSHFNYITDSQLGSDITVFHLLNDPAWKYPHEWKEEEPAIYKLLLLKGFIKE